MSKFDWGMRTCGLLLESGGASSSAKRHNSAEGGGYGRILGHCAGLVRFWSHFWTFGTLSFIVSETVLTKREHQLVIAGPYQWVRHPLYTTDITLFVALGLMEASWFVLFMTTVAALLIQLVVIPAEERALVAKFGDRSGTYMGRTGRMLP